MATWVSGTVVQGTDLDVEQQFNKSITNRGERGAYNGVSMGDYLGLPVVGIDANQIPTVCRTISDAISALNAKIEQIDANADQDMAFKSPEIQSAVREYISTVKEYCKALVSNLAAFSDKLVQVKNAWEGSSSAFASDSITPDTSNLSGATEKYQSQYSGFGAN